MPKYPGLLKFWGIIAILFAILYAIVGFLLLAGEANNLLPDYEDAVTIIIVIAYGMALISLILGIACLAKKLVLAKVFGIIFAVISLVSLINNQLSADTFSIFDLVAVLLGVSVLVTAKTE